MPKNKIMVPLFSPDRKTVEDFAPVNLNNPDKEIKKIFLPGRPLPEGLKPIPRDKVSGIEYFQMAKYSLQTIGPDNRLSIGNIPKEKIGDDPIIIYVRDKEI